jgi:hypothetical protein
MAKTNEQVAASFAAGNSAESNNMMTDGQRLYSYGTMIGIKIQGQVILSDNSMSPTTGRHISLASRAVKYTDVRADVFRYGASNPCITPADVVESLSVKSAELIKKSSRARSNRDYLVNSARTLFKQAKDLCKSFNLDLNTIYPTDCRDAVALGFTLEG